MVRRIWGALLGAGMMLLAQAGFAQSETVKTGSLNLKVSPQHWFVNCLNLEVEKRLGRKQQHAVVVIPRLYSGQTRTVDRLCGREFDGPSEVQGYGVELLHKIYRTKTPVDGAEVYFAYGLNYHRFELEFERYGWVEEMQNDGLNYFTYQLASFHETISRRGGMVMMGTQKTFFGNRLFTDIYSGLGYRKSTSDTQLQESQFSANIFDYGSSGLYMTAGLKLGVWLY